MVDKEAVTYSHLFGLWRLYCWQVFLWVFQVACILIGIIAVLAVVLVGTIMMLAKIWLIQPMNRGKRK